MFACLLSCIGSFPSKDALSFKYKPNDSGAAFDIEVNGKDTTYKGWFVCFKKHDNTSPDACNNAFDENGIAETDDFKVKISHSIDPKTNYTLIAFTVTNLGEKRNISLGVFADVKMDGNDNPIIEVPEDKRSFTVLGNNFNYSVLINTPGGSTDNSYFGKIDNSLKDSPNNYPYFDNSAGQNIEGQDSCFAFSWLNREVDHGKSLIFEIVMAANEKMHSPPYIEFLENKFNPIFVYNETSTVPIKITDFNEGETITVEIMDSTGQNISYSFTTSAESKSNVSNIFITPKEECWIKVRAHDSLGIFYELNRTFMVTKRPELNVTSQINGLYKNGGYIDISGTVYDDTKVTLFYFFYLEDDAQVFINDYKRLQDGYRLISTLHEYFDVLFRNENNHKMFFQRRIDKICNNKKVSFNDQISIPSLLRKGNSILNIFVIDEYGFASNNNISIKFNYDNTEYTPELQNVHINSNQTHPGQIVLITGEAKLNNNGENITVYAEIEGYQYSNITTLQSNNNWANFSGNVTIPFNIPAGEYKFNIQAKDDDGVNSRNQTLPFSVYIPENTQSNTVPPPSNTSASINNPAPTRVKDLVEGDTANKNYTPIFIAVPLCIIVVIVIIVVVVLYLKCKHEEQSEEKGQVELEETALGGGAIGDITYTNPMFTTTEFDDFDPFADEFEEKSSSNYFVADNNAPQQSGANEHEGENANADASANADGNANEEGSANADGNANEDENTNV